MVTKVSCMPRCDVILGKIDFIFVTMFDGGAGEVKIIKKKHDALCSCSIKQIITTNIYKILHFT